MPRYNVQNFKGEWACFSSIIDDFVTDFMPREDYEEWRKEQYGSQCVPLEQANQMAYEKCIKIIEKTKRFQRNRVKL